MKKLFLHFVLLLSLTTLNAQDCATIVKHIDLEGEETVWNSGLSKDGFIYISGTLSRPGNTNASFVVKSDTLGNIIWSRVIPGSGRQLLKNVYPTNDSGVITTGISSTYPANPNHAAIVIKWDKFGNRQWSRSLNSNSQYGDWGMGVMQASDGGYVITGNLNSTGFQSAAYILKVSANGGFEWAKRYTYFEGVEFKGAIEDNDSYIVAGEYLFNSNTSYRPLIVKVSKENGNVQSIKSFTLPGNVASSGALKVRPDGGYFFNGYDLTYSIGFISDYRQVVIYLNADLNFEKAIRLSHSEIKNQDLSDLIPLADGGFISSSGGSRNTDDAHFYRVDKDGGIVWRRKIGGTGGQQLTSTNFLEDSTVVLVGNTSKNSVGNTKDILWLRARVGSIATACGIQESDVVSNIISISNLSFSFGSVTDLSSTLWVTINPAIQEDVHNEKYNCKPDCKEPTCGLIVKNFDIGGDERVWSTATSPDNYVYLVGGTQRTGGMQASFILKTDSAGIPIWSRAIPGSGQQFFTKVLATADSGAIAVGLSRTYPSSVSGSAIVVKWDKNGVRKWSRSYSTNSPNYDIGLAIIETSDGGYLLAGTHNSAGFVARGFIIKLDINGNAQWIKHYPYTEGADMMSILEVEDGFLVSGDYLYNANTTYGVFIVKVRKTDGEILQTKSWAMPDKSIIIHSFLHKTKDGFYLACSQMLAQIPNYFNNMRQTVLHLDNSLNLIRTTRISHNKVKNGLVADIAALKDGSFIGAAGGDNEGDDVDIYKVSPEGSLQWRTRIGGIGGQNIWAMTPTEDSSYVFGGISTTAGKKDILWLKAPIGKAIEGCDAEESDAVVNLISLDQTSFSFSQITNGNTSNWVSINPAIESDGFQLTYSCGELCAPGDVLPLKIINFSGSRNENNQISLLLETANEFNVEVLNIEYSLNGTTFYTLDVLSSKGGVYNQYHYSTEKLNAKTGDLYFRIKVIDLDGRVYLSNILMLKTQRKISQIFKVFPNPSKGVFNISFNSQKNGLGRIRIVDNNGRIVYNRESQISNGDNSILVGNGLKLTSGVYYVLFENDGVLYSEKVIIH